jgi:hypothetical protein
MSIFLLALSHEDGQPLIAGPANAAWLRRRSINGPAPLIVAVRVLVHQDPN